MGGDRDGGDDGGEGDRDGEAGGGERRGGGGESRSGEDPEESMHAKKGEGAGGRRLARLGEGGCGVRGEGGHALALGRAQGVEEAAHIPQRVEQAEQALPVA